MDSLTHILVGHAMGAVASTMVSPAAGAVYWAAVIGNSLPDIDVPVSLIMRRGISMHRTLTHTIPGGLLLSAGVSVLLCRIFPGAPLGLVFAWTLLGSLIHLGMDCLNLFGVRPFWPITGRSVELGVLHIVDPALLAVLGLPTLAAALGLASKTVLIISFFMVPIYIIHRMRTARRLFWKLKRAGSIKARIIPWFTNWRYVFETATSIELGYWKGGQRFTLNTFLKIDSPLVRASMKLPQVVSFLEAAQYPYAQLAEDEVGHTVIWGDVLRQQRADFRPLVVRIP